MLAATDAIVLRSRKQGDTSKIVSLYSREFGLVDVIAKGARQQRSKFGGALEPFTDSKIVFYKKEHSELYLLSGAEINSAHRNLTSDLDRIEAATRIAELLIRSQRHEEGHPDLFELVRQTLAEMDTAERSDSVWAVLLWFFLRYASLCGFGITLPVRMQPEAAWYFDAEHGCAIETDGRGTSDGDRFTELTPEMASALGYLQTHTIDAAASLRLSAGCRRVLLALFRAYFSRHLVGMQGGRAKTESVFAALRTGRS